MGLFGNYLRFQSNREKMSLHVHFSGRFLTGSTQKVSSVGDAGWPATGVYCRNTSTKEITKFIVIFFFYMESGPGGIF